MMRPLWVALTSLLVLAACAEVEPVSIRPGLTSEANLDRLRPPSGVTYRFALEDGDLPVPVELTLRSSRRGARIYDYNGAMSIRFPDNVNFENVGDLVAQTFGVKDVTFRGSTVSFPVKLRTDNRFRSLNSSFVGRAGSYVPHDCFAVLGTCSYRAVNAEGQALDLVSETTETNGVWRSVTKPKRGSGVSGTQRMTYSLDRNGVLLDMVLSSNQGGQRSRLVFRRK